VRWTGKTRGQAIRIEDRQEVATVRLIVDERPSTLTAVCAPPPGCAIEAHAQTVGISGVFGIVFGTVGQADISVQQQHDSVQGQRTQALRSSLLTDRRTNGYARAKATGMIPASVVGVEVSGVPPQGRPV
jgi:hypothetical protein